MQCAAGEACGRSFADKATDVEEIYTTKLTKRKQVNQRNHDELGGDPSNVAIRRLGLRFTMVACGNELGW